MSITRQQFLTSRSLTHFLDITFEHEADLDEATDFVLRKLKLRQFGPQSRLAAEDGSGPSMYFIEQGEAAVVREEEDGKASIPLATRDCFGELPVLSGDSRWATVRAESSVTAYELSMADFEEIICRYPHLTGTVLSKLYRGLASCGWQSERQREQLNKSEQLRGELGRAFTYIILMIGLYVFLLRGIQSGVFAGVGFDIDYAFSRVMEAALLLMIVLFIKKSSFTRSDFGLTLEGWKRSAIDAVAVSVAVMIALYALKWCSIRYRFDFVGDGQVISLHYLSWNFGVYAIVAFLQEFITRGVVQGAIHRLLVGRWAGATSVMISTLIFGLMHAHQPGYMIIASLASGLLWGFMYMRHQTLVGVTLSHFLVGNFAKLLGFLA